MERLLVPPSSLSAALTLLYQRDAQRHTTISVAIIEISERHREMKLPDNQEETLNPGTTPRSNLLISQHVSSSTLCWSLVLISTSDVFSVNGFSLLNLEWPDLWFFIYSNFKVFSRPFVSFYIFGWFLDFFVCVCSIKSGWILAELGVSKRLCVTVVGSMPAQMHAVVEVLGPLSWWSDVRDTCGV